MEAKLKAKLDRLKDRYKNETRIPPSDVLELFSDMLKIVEDISKRLGK